MHSEMNREHLRDLQLVQLDTLKKVIEICEMNNLRYFAIAGTLLGAVRHKGFIPWDDDIDISMPRADYDIFMQLAPQYLDSHHYLHPAGDPSPYCESHYLQMSKIYDTRMKVATGAKEKNSTHPSLDIFTLDGVPNSRLLRFFFVNLLLFRKLLFVLSQFDVYVNQRKNSRPFSERILLKIFNRISVQRFIDTKKQFNACDRLLKKYEWTQTRHCSMQLLGQYRFKAIYPHEWIGEGIKIQFEDIEIVVPCNYHEYLRQLYGENYMELPPESKQNFHVSHILLKETESA